MLPSIIFKKGQGGLGRSLAGQDFISALTFYCADGSLPSGWTTGKRTVALYQAADAITNGILPNYNPNNLFADANFADATAAAGAITFTVAPSASGDTVTVTAKLLSLAGVVTTVTLCTYTTVSGDTTATLVATHVTTAINANTYLNGYSATSALGVVAVTAPKSQGIWGGLSAGANAGLAVTIVQTSGTAGSVTAAIGVTTAGTQSLQAIWYYHISEYFRLQPKGTLYVSFYAVNSNYTFTELTTIQNFTNGAIRQMGVYMGKPGYTHAFAVGDTTAINTEVVTNDDGNYMPMSVLYAADLVTTYSASLSALPNLNNYTNNKVSVIIGQDGAAQGNLLFQTSGYSITCIGAALGAASLANVQECIGWVSKFNLTNGTELNAPALANGQLLGQPAVSQNYLTAIDTSRYIFCLTYVGQAGTWFNDSHCAVALSSDYAYLENNRTIDKATRGLTSSLLPQLKGPLLLNGDGTLADTTIAYLIGLASVPLNAMVSANNISDFSVSIPATQNVQTTGNLIINVQLIGIATSRQMTVNIGFVLSLTTQ